MFISMVKPYSSFLWGNDATVSVAVLHPIRVGEVMQQILW